MFKTRRLLTSIFLLALVAIGCKEASRSSRSSEIKHEGVPVKVLYVAGDSYGTRPYLSLPFNIGERDSMQYVIIGKRIGDRDSVAVKVLGGLSLKVDKEVKHYVVTVPSDPSLNGVPIKDFGALTTKYSSVMWMTEYYLTHAYEKAEFLKWYDDQEVKLIVR